MSSKEPPTDNKGVSLRSKDLDADERHWLDAEEQRSVDSGAWQPVSAAENRWVSRAFLVPKPGLKDGRKQFRLVVDLRPLNLHCKSSDGRGWLSEWLCVVAW